MLASLPCSTLDSWLRSLPQTERPWFQRPSTWLTATGTPLLTTLYVDRVEGVDCCVGGDCGEYGSCIQNRLTTFQ